MLLDSNQYESGHTHDAGLYDALYDNSGHYGGQEMVTDGDHYSV